MALKSIPQKQFLKGVNASVAYNSQPKGIVARVSNLTFNTRGAMRSCDQNMGISTLNGTGPVDDEGAFTSIQFFQPTQSARQILAIQKDLDTQLAAPTGLGASASGSGGTLPTNTYFYVVTALDGVGGETTASNEATVGVTLGQNVSLAWTSVPNATGYNVYRGTSSSGELLLSGTGLPRLVNSYTDTGAATPTASVAIVAAPNGLQVNSFSGFTITITVASPILVGTSTPLTITGASPTSFNFSGYHAFTTVVNQTTFQMVNVNGLDKGLTGGGGTLTFASGTGIAPPTSNTTQTLSLIDVSNPGYTKPGSVIKSFPADAIPEQPPFPITGPGGSSSGIPGGGTATNPAGGNVPGQTTPIPDMIAFAGKMILALGNGFAPYESDGTTGGTVALTNSFTGAFPGWVAATAYNLGDLIEPTTPNGHIYKCIQAGISSPTTEPVFPTGSGQTVNDGTGTSSIIWQENGSDATPAPRGAAHAINHAGSLWLWNTSPTTSSDQLDGPSVLKMSDANTPNSWNPQNVAFVSKDDGQQGMGLASFTIAESGIAPEGSLVLFKEFSTYQVIGVFGATDFEIQQAQTDLGCIAPRTIRFVPGFGIVRMTHLGVAVFDGVRDRLISEEIRPYLFGGIADIAAADMSFIYLAKADMVATPPMYVMAIPVLGNGGNGSLTRLCCFDLVLKAWTIIDLPFPIESIRQLNIPGSLPMTVFGGFDDGMISRWQVGDEQGWQAWIDPSLEVHTGTPLTWTFRTPTVVGDSSTDRVTFRRVLVRGQWQGVLTAAVGQPTVPNNSTGTSSFMVNVAVDRVNLPVNPARNILTPTGAASDNSFELVQEIGRTGLDSYATISGTQAIGGAPIELVEVDWLVISRPVGSLVRV